MHSLLRILLGIVMSSESETAKKSERKLEVRLASTPAEVEETLRLRYRVFNEEMGEGLPESELHKMDKDEYDDFCDHLIVLDEARDNMIVGTYRIIRSRIAKENKGFYSETEFNIASLYDIGDEVAELGRSCVHEDYRDGSVINMLWKGLGWYVNEFNVRYLVGCGSIHETDPELASKVYAWFREKGALADGRFKAEPLATHKLDGFDPNFQIDDMKEITRSVPGLLKGYLRGGAKIVGEPALDSVFGVIDFFLAFDSEEITRRYGKQYLGRDEN